MKANELWTIRPQADPRSVLRGEKYRITILTSRLLRLEYAADGAFRDTATQMALCREFPVPEYSVTESEQGCTGLAIAKYSRLSAADKG